jgi:CRISPR-associated endoribonuclease Cas6
VGYRQFTAPCHVDVKCNIAQLREPKIMRLYFELSPNTQPVPFDYQHFLTGTFHKWLGNNALHDGISLYSLGWLSGGVTRRDGKRIEGGLDFPRGAGWFISAHDETLLHKIADAALRDGNVCCGMEVIEIRTQSTPDFGPRFCFKAGSPVLARSKEIEGRVTHYTCRDEVADGVLTQTLRHKLDVAGLNSSDVSVKFDRTYRNPKIKLVTIKGIGNRASVCPVIVEGPPEAVSFAWNVGVGHLTGNGFGSLL